MHALSIRRSTASAACRTLKHPSVDIISDAARRDRVYLRIQVVR